MLCTFKTEYGALIVQSEDIKAIEDCQRATMKAMADENTPAPPEPPISMLVWMIGTSMHDREIKGTALENMARIQQEELDLVARVEGHRQSLAQRMQQGYPAQPVPRGRK